MTQQQPLPSCSSTHCAQVRDHRVYTWATHASRGNRFGQLGRPVASEDHGEAHAVALPASSGTPVLAAAGGNKDAGHTAVLTDKGLVYTFGCDRWLQLGLGSTEAGAVGYSWEGGKIWRESPQLVFALAKRPAPTKMTKMLDTQPAPTRIIDVSCGADHTVALAANRKDVFTWGRGEHGQLGRGRKLFVSGGPDRASELSMPAENAAGDGGGRGAEIAAVLAIGNCTATVVDGGSGPAGGGRIAKAVGKCRTHMELLNRLAAEAVARQQ